MVASVYDVEMRMFDAIHARAVGLDLGLARDVHHPLAGMDTSLGAPGGLVGKASKRCPGSHGGANNSGSGSTGLFNLLAGDLDCHTLPGLAGLPVGFLYK